MNAYPERFPRGNCHQNARWMVQLHPELSYVQGYLVFTDPGELEHRVTHAWNETPDGLVVDSTAWAFEGQTLAYRFERDPGTWARLEARAQVHRSVFEDRFAGKIGRAIRWH